MKENFTKVIEEWKEMETNGYTEKSNLDRFNDPIAKTTPWTPMVRGGSTSRTHRFHLDKDGNVQFKLSLDVIFNKSLPLIIGVFCIFAGIKWLSILFILMGLLSLLDLKKLSIPITFDVEKGLYTKDGTHVEIEDIHAIQIIEEHVGSDESSYLGYELNWYKAIHSVQRYRPRKKSLRYFGTRKSWQKYFRSRIWDGTTDT